VTTRTTSSCLATQRSRPDARHGEAQRTAGDGVDAHDPRLPFEALYERWFEHVTRWVRALGASEAEQEDLTQEVFLVAHRRLADFDGKNPAGWLYQIARRKVRDHRRLTWIKHVFGNRQALTEATLATQLGPLDSLETRRKAELFQRLLDTLSDEQRAAFVLFELEGASGEEIAGAQGVPINTVWARIFEARKALRQRLARWERASGAARARPPRK
jgi:RNA polymerase sigma-70 factor, ECF subfamily